MALRPQPRSTALGRALELGIQFGACVLVGMGLGYYLDRWLGTAPLFLLIFMLFGFAAGLRTLLRFARDSSAPGPSMADDSKRDEAPPPQDPRE